MIIKLYFLKCCKNLYHILKKNYLIYYFSHKKKKIENLLKKKNSKKKIQIFLKQINKIFYFKYHIHM